MPYGLATNDTLVGVGAYHLSVAERRILTLAQGSNAFRC
jgi:hypothetical protein